MSDMQYDKSSGTSVKTVWPGTPSFVYQKHPAAITGDQGNAGGEVRPGKYTVPAFSKLTLNK
jgi:hypothetical protein